jgi:hypothetical protein
LLVSLMAVASFGAAACTAPEPESRRPGPKPQWDVSSLQAQLPGVLVVRGRTLAIAQLDASAETTIWTAPAETTPTILDVDRTGGRIAVLLRSKRETTTPPVRTRGWEIPPSVVDTGVVVLSADGMAKRYSLRAVEHRVSLEAGQLPSVTTPIDTLIAERVTSGAFVGRDLLLATDGPTFHYPRVGTPLRISPDGSCTVLSVADTETVGNVSGFVGLAGGGSAVIRGPQGTPFTDGSPPRAMIASVREGALSTSSASFGSIRDRLGDVGSGPATQSIAYVESGRNGDAWAVGKIIAATLDGGTWKKSSLPLSTRKDPNGRATRSLITAQTIMDAPGTGPHGEELLPIGEYSNRYDVPSHAALVRVGPSGVTTEGAGLSVDWSLEPGPLTWAWLDRFGR